MEACKLSMSALEDFEKESFHVKYKSMILWDFDFMILRFYASFFSIYV